MRAFFQLAFLALLASTFTGCFDNRPLSRVDSGPVIVPMDGGTDPRRDGGPIILQDSGPGCVPESSASACTDFADNDCDGQSDCNDISCCSVVSCATGTLCGNMRVDAGTSCGTTGYFEPVPSSCLPRCSSGTLTAIDACADYTCAAAALDRDTTPSVTMTLRNSAGTAMNTIDLDCRFCWDYQDWTCWIDYCPDEFVPWYDCAAGGSGACDTEIADLQACLDTNTTAVQSCRNSRIPSCFPG